MPGVEHDSYGSPGLGMVAILLDLFGLDFVFFFVFDGCFEGFQGLAGLSG